MHGDQPDPGNARTFRRQRSAVWAAAAAFALVMVVVIGGSLQTRRSAEHTERTVLLNAAYERAATAVADEESLDRAYRIEPSSRTHAQHVAAALEVPAALYDVRRLGSDGDRRLASQLLGDHARYVVEANRLFAAVDGHRPDIEVDAIDNGAVDPIFESLKVRLDAAADAHQQQTLAYVASARRTGRVVLGLDIAALLFGLAAITASGIALGRSRQRLVAQSELNRYQALHDSLTGLPNRALFQDRVAQALRVSARTGEQVAVMLADLDRFKEVNDTLGHHYGDVLLQQVGARFRSTLRAADSVARLGGDEFALLLPGIDRDDAVDTVERLQNVLSEPFVVQDITLDVEASVGIALVGAGTDVAIALRRADVAMYEAKSQHVPYAFYETDRDDNTRARLAVLGELRRAVANGEIVMYYQPKVDSNDRLHSVEALVRWNHPTRGLLAPEAFIPLAESTAVIHPLTDEILHQVLAQARSWIERGWSVPIAVNISTRSLLDVAFPTKVRRLLADARVPAALLSLELTESTIMHDPTLALAVLRELDELGVGLSIDDFGTGYSSMAYLKSLPVKELKIDRTFVNDMTHDADDAVLVRSAVDLGHNLGLHVVAEGVEDAATEHALAAIGCDLMQGFYIQRPAPAAELDGWLSRHLRLDTVPV